MPQKIVELVMEKKKYYLTKIGLILAIMVSGMTAFEFAKHYLVPHVTIWQSHVITIIFSTIVAIIAGFFTISKMSSLYFLALKEIERRKLLQGEIAKISEREKRLLGENLHDGLAQQLTGISYMLQSLATKTDQIDSETSTGIFKILKLVKNVLDQTRNLAKGIYPLELSENGLLDGIEELIGNFKDIYNIHCTLVCDDKKPWKKLNADISRQLYLIAQEAFNNAIKHGRATHIEVKLTQEEQDLVITISDNGQGPATESISEGGIGFSIMAHRAELVGGTLQFHRGKELGAVVECRLKGKI